MPVEAGHGAVPPALRGVNPSGTDGSNPASSREESAANLLLPRLRAVRRWLRLCKTVFGSLWTADADVAFVPLAMPLIFGPGAIATVLGMSSLARHPFAEILPLAAIILAILATMGATYLFLAYADIILSRIGPRGIDAATRIVGFFVAAMGMGLIFHGVTEAIRTYLLTGTPH